MKTATKILIVLTLLFTSCSKPHDTNDCDEVIFVRDTYISGFVSGYYYTGTDTIWQRPSVCGNELDNLLSILKYDSLVGGNLYTMRYVFKNHNF